MASFDDSLPMILNRSLDNIMPGYRELFARHEVTEQQWRVLRVLWTSETVTSIELSNRTLLPAPSLVGIIDRLEKKELVCRIRSKKDRRAVYVVATPKGRALEKRVTPEVEKLDSTIRAAVSPKEWQSMQDTLEKISKHLNQSEFKKAKAS